MKRPALELRIHPLTPDRFVALEDLFGEEGPVSRCWCMYCRIGSEYRRRSPDQNRAAFREVVREGPPPGLIAYLGDLAVGWCQLTPRDALPWLDRGGRLRRVDSSGQPHETYAQVVKHVHGCP